MRVLPLPMMVSLPPIPSNSLNVPLEPVFARRREAGRVIGVGEVRAADELDRAQRVGADRGIPGHHPGRHVDGDAGGDGVVEKREVDAPVETAETIDEVVAGAVP